MKYQKLQEALKGPSISNTLEYWSKNSSYVNVFGPKIRFVGILEKISADKYLVTDENSQFIYGPTKNETLTISSGYPIIIIELNDVKEIIPLENDDGEKFISIILK